MMSSSEEQGNSQIDVAAVDMNSNNQIRRKRKCYSIDFKLQAVKYAKDHRSKQAASIKFCVDRAMIRDWMDKEEELKTMNTNVKRLCSSTHKAMLPEVEEQLLS